jgi:hypothetical protein
MAITALPRLGGNWGDQQLVRPKLGYYELRPRNCANSVEEIADWHFVLAH